MSSARGTAGSKKRHGSYNKIDELWQEQASAAMREQGYTQETLAIKLGVHKSTISRMLGGPRNMSTNRYADRVADLLGVPLPLDRPVDEARDLLEKIRHASPARYERFMADMREAAAYLQTMKKK